MKAVLNYGIDVIKAVLHAIIVPAIIVYFGGKYLEWWSVAIAAMYILAVLMIYEYLESIGIKKKAQPIFMALVGIEAFAILFFALNIVSA